MKFKEFVVKNVSALETPHSLKEPATGKVFPMVTLEMDVIHPSGQPELLRLHFAPQHLESLLPKLQDTTQRALLLATKPGDEMPH